MRKVTELIWHCTATPEGREVTVAEIDRWHKERGWSGIGYHKVVHLDGRVSEGRPETQVGAHVANRNANTIGYTYVGGTEKGNVKKAKDTRTDAQKRTMERLTREAIARYGLTLVSGHSDYANKACPCFNARAEYANLLKPKAQPESWDNGMPDKDPAHDMEEIKNSRTIQGGTVATSGTVGTAITEATQTLSPFTEASRLLKYLFIALTVAGVAYALYARWDDAGRPLPWRRQHA